LRTTGVWCTYNKLRFFEIQGGSSPQSSVLSPSLGYCEVHRYSIDFMILMKIESVETVYDINKVPKWSFGERCGKWKDELNMRGICDFQTK
jgi:hypothetical protein